MRRALLLACIACIASVACAGAGSQGRPPVAADAPPQPPAFDLSGAWASGTTGEPAARHLRLQLECNYTPSLWVLQQRGDTVRAWVIPESRAQGVRAREVAMPVPAVGRISGLDVTMSLGASRWALRYDSTSGHLRGTLDGKPFWAAPQDIARDGGCIPVP